MRSLEGLSRALDHVGQPSQKPFLPVFCSTHLQLTSSPTHCALGVEKALLQPSMFSVEERSYSSIITANQRL
jgi:hypothetical protein